MGFFPNKYRDLKGPQKRNYESGPHWKWARSDLAVLSETLGSPMIARDWLPGLP